MTFSQLDVGCVISSPSGLINLLAAPYDLHAETKSEVSVTWRKKEVANVHIEGTYLVHAERENVMEQVYVWVENPNEKVLRTALLNLENAFSQLYYTISFRLGQDIETWTCETADYTVDRHYEFAHNKIALVKATVPRLPQVAYS